MTMKWTDLVALKRALQELITDWEKYVSCNLECLCNGCCYIAKVCDGFDLPTVSFCHGVFTNLRHDLPDKVPQEALFFFSAFQFPHREVEGFEALPLHIHFDHLDESQTQTNESMKQVFAAMVELGIFIRAAERCRKTNGMEEFQTALQRLLSTMSEMACAYIDYREKQKTVHV